MRLAVVLLALAGCVRSATHRCASDEDCPALGRCEVDNVCSLANPACPSGWSYGEGAGPLAGTCTPPGGDDPDAAPDAPDLDAPDLDAPVDAQVDAPIDAPPDAPEGPTVAHLARTDSLLGTTDWTIGTNTTIDTTALTATPALPPGVTLTVANHEPPSPTTSITLAVLHVANLNVANGAVLRVVGDRPLVIVSRSTIVAGRIDASADLSIAGAGGSGPTTGTGAGGAGMHVGAFDDGGGGGAGHGSTGARGGDDGGGNALGGTAGPAYSDSMITFLEGGSGGGTVALEAACTGSPRFAGAGGGALQIFAETDLTVVSSGGIEAGGGGGAGGRLCSGTSEAGRGGGSGGSIYLQAGTITLGGLVSANGGGGGAPGLATGDGSAGADGALGSMAAAGGTNGTRLGGNGGARGIAPTAGLASGTSDGGGGGGAFGRIVLRSAMITGGGNTSPSATVLAL